MSVGGKATEGSKGLIVTHELCSSNDLTCGKYIPDVEKFHFHAVSSHEIRRAVMSFSSNKPPRFDKVTLSVVKNALPCIFPVLTDMVNRSLLSSVFPARSKISEVIPLPKEGDHQIPNNNRPVSLRPAASKICERVALNQLITFLYNKKRLSQHQSGNKKLHSCETVNVVITTKALEALYAKKVALVVLLDLWKAFGSIDQTALLAKLRASKP